LHYYPYSAKGVTIALSFLTNSGRAKVPSI